MVRNRKAQKGPNPAKSLEISEDEQWRLIHEAGILAKADTAPALAQVFHDNDEEVTPLAEEIFGAVVLIIPFSFLLLMMEILIHYQYGKQPSFQALMDRMIPGVPILSILIFYTTRYKQHRKMQFLLFVASVLAGSRMIYLINNGSWLLNMRQCPPLATIWVYTIVQLELGSACLNLVTVGSYVWWKGLQIRF